MGSIMNYITSLKGLSTDLAQSCVKAIEATKFKTNLGNKNNHILMTMKSTHGSHIYHSPRNTW